jgi:tRNA pseudouridine55 synthase
MQHGLVLIDKPQDWTSFDVVAKMRGVLGTKKVGHGGTLDPLATGLLVLGANQGTKLLQFLLGQDKSYTATVRLGQSTLSDDSQSEILDTKDALAITADQIDQLITALTGPIDQIPSSVSAKKIDGVRAYDLVRQGKEVDLKPKSVVIRDFARTSELSHHDGLVDFDISVKCSSGTYIRALARDMGQTLEVGGHLIGLRRTAVASFVIDDATAITEEPRWISLADAASKLFPSYEISSDQERDLRHGKKIELESDEPEIALTREQYLIALATKTGSQYKSITVFQEEQ